MSTHVNDQADGWFDQVGGEWQLRFVRRLAHPREKVWLALTEPADQLAHRALRLAEQVQDGPPPSIGQHLEHSRHIRKYAQSVIYLSRHTAERLPVSRPDVLG